MSKMNLLNIASIAVLLTLPSIFGDKVPGTTYEHTCIGPQTPNRYGVCGNNIPIVLDMICGKDNSVKRRNLFEYINAQAVLDSISMFSCMRKWDIFFGCKMQGCKTFELVDQWRWNKEIHGRLHIMLYYEDNILIRIGRGYDAKIGDILLNKKDAMSYITKRAVQGIVCECCYHKCSYNELSEYCIVPVTQK